MYFENFSFPFTDALCLLLASPVSSRYEFRSGYVHPEVAFGGGRQFREVNGGAICTRRNGGGVSGGPRQCQSSDDRELPGVDSNLQRSGTTRQRQQLRVLAATESFRRTARWRGVSRKGTSRRSITAEI
ncbi:hypothetical protein F3Y22_tig00116962pilonHSYRG01041 [Hibiscus syriacus]|uniref:Secreted protein n=1 Tax=Hibiscus syriacus TaxID=106335 RepID=A0A6A2WJW5_HIBSY|nr:hypothetical protein F3Y22_tig00116962pilonHSYRG01041 [Hibiscus syriacus]